MTRAEWFAERDAIYAEAYAEAKPFLDEARALEAKADAIYVRACTRTDALGPTPK